jgi:hypothetical protein
MNEGKILLDKVYYLIDLNDYYYNDIPDFDASLFLKVQHFVIFTSEVTNIHFKNDR